MNVTLLKQNKRQNCGQTVMAMVLGKSIAETEKLYGHGHATYRQEHVRVLKKMGFDVADDFQEYTDRLPEVAMVRLAFRKQKPGKGTGYSKKTKRMGHLVLRVNGKFYDPNGYVIGWHELHERVVIDCFLEVKQYLDQGAGI